MVGWGRVSWRNNAFSFVVNRGNMWGHFPHHKKKSLRNGISKNFLYFFESKL